MKSKIVWGIIILFFFGFWQTAFSERVFTFIPQWRPQAQFAGFYVAYDKGFYKKYGIDVKFLSGGPDAPSEEYLKEGKADFATMWLSTAIKLKANGVDLVNIAQIFQRSSLVLVAWKNKVKSIRDLNGKKIGVWGSSFMVPFRAFLNKYKIKCKIVPKMSSINLFLMGGVDAATAMWYNEYNEIINSGVQPDQLTIFMFYKYGLNFPEDGIYVLRKTYDRYPTQCRAFVKASIEGWLYAFKHPEEAVRIVMKYMFKAHVPTNRAHQEWMLKSVKKAFFYGGKIGILNKKEYEFVAKTLKRQGLIDKIPPFDSFYKGCYGK
ncbi:ABC transporter substrate-binding protein [Hippea alviniae]|uniref:ABC transporter substrate-binding protein n=1 Tax=Hippea alviniae TaxID=1279027 RepID=UPI0003B40CD2|nr:ABC transporter substrate-binding protein [Hippea alviniae]